mgnify:CR=1 FL=1
MTVLEGVSHCNKQKSMYWVYLQGWVFSSHTAIYPERTLFAWKKFHKESSSVDIQNSSSRFRLVVLLVYHASLLAQI